MRNLDLNEIALDAQAELNAGSLDGYAERILELVVALRAHRAVIQDAFNPARRDSWEAKASVVLASCTDEAP